VEHGAWHELTGHLNDAMLTLGTDTTNMTIDASGLTNVGADLTLVGTGYGGSINQPHIDFGDITGVAAIKIRRLRFEWIRFGSDANTTTAVGRDTFDFEDLKIGVFGDRHGVIIITSAVIHAIRRIGINRPGKPNPPISSHNSIHAFGRFITLIL
jgi:hypothetical protein